MSDKRKKAGRNDLTLEPSGTGGCKPNPKVWKPKRGTTVRIINNSGAAQLLTNVQNSVLRGSRTTAILNKTVMVPKEGWEGKAGRLNGTYTYDDGGSPLIVSMRTGHIDPS